MVGPRLAVLAALLALGTTTPTALPWKDHTTGVTPVAHITATATTTAMPSPAARVRGVGAAPVTATVRVPGAVPVTATAHVPGAAPVTATARDPGAAPVTATASDPGAAPVAATALDPGSAPAPGPYSPEDTSLEQESSEEDSMEAQHLANIIVAYPLQSASNGLVKVTYGSRKTSYMHVEQILRE
ncbi:uncharacterized protein LOC134539963 [Bacillus rossius redtenbacheri]|uniref:uncharacterized protein LOC134539963 n=1 Tax=Bacillus rossius redtenbacheri TaxID=93214 RepID=UPI002FDE1E2E